MNASCAEEFSVFCMKTLQAASAKQCVAATCSVARANAIRVARPKAKLNPTRRYNLAPPRPQWPRSPTPSRPKRKYNLAPPSPQRQRSPTRSPPKCRRYNLAPRSPTPPPSPTWSDWYKKYCDLQDAVLNDQMELHNVIRQEEHAARCKTRLKVNLKKLEERHQQLAMTFPKDATDLFETYFPIPRP